MLHGKLSRSRRRLLYRRLGLAVPLRFSGDGGGDGVVSGEDRRRIGLFQADFGVCVFGGASSGPSARSASPGGVGLGRLLGRLAYQLAEKPGWDLSPTFHGGFVPPRGSSSSGGLGALIPVASDPSVSDDVFCRVVRRLQSKSGSTCCTRRQQKSVLLHRRGRLQTGCSSRR